jgi:hypothetical protein
LTKASSLFCRQLSCTRYSWFTRFTTQISTNSGGFVWTYRKVQLQKSQPEPEDQPQSFPASSLCKRDISLTQSRGVREVLSRISISRLMIQSRPSSQDSLPTNEPRWPSCPCPSSFVYSWKPLIRLSCHPNPSRPNPSRSTARLHTRHRPKQTSPRYYLSPSLEVDRTIYPHALFLPFCRVCEPSAMWKPRGNIHL